MSVHVLLNLLNKACKETSKYSKNVLNFKLLSISDFK